jgi:GAF domain/ANTAR domain
MVDYRVTDDQGDRLRVLARATLDSEPGVVPDVAIGLARLCRAATDELSCAGSAVTLMTTRGAHRLVASSGDPGEALDELQFDLGEGPARDAFAAGRPVLTSDIRADRARWPGFAPQAVEAGLLAVFCFPLQLGAVRFGVMSFVDDSPRTLTGQQTSACTIFAEVATELLLDSSPNGAPGHNDVHRALPTHHEVYQAQGMTVVDLGVTLTEALARMRATAYAEGITLRELATSIVAGRRLDDTTADGGA